MSGPIGWWILGASVLAVALGGPSPATQPQPADPPEAEEAKQAEAAQALQEAQETDSPHVHLVKASELALRLEAEGRVDSAQRRKVRVAPREYNGVLEVAQVVKRRGRVNLGEALVRFDTTRLDEQLRKARESLDRAGRRLELLRQEQRILREKDVVEIVTVVGGG